MKQFYYVIWNALLICGCMAAANPAMAITIDQISGLPSNTDVSVPDLGISGTTNVEGILQTSGFSCEEGKVYTALSNGNPFTFTCTPRNFFGVKEVAALAFTVGGIFAFSELNNNDSRSGSKSVTQSCTAAVNPCFIGTCPTSITMTNFAPSAAPYTGFSISFGGGAGAMTGAPSSPNYTGNGFTLPGLGSGYTCYATWGNGTDETGGVSISCFPAMLGQTCNLGCGGAPANPPLN